MTSPRRKAIKWRKWKRKNPEKADSAQLRKIMRHFITGSCFTRKAKRQYAKAFAAAALEPNPFQFIIKPQIELVGFRYVPFGDDDGYRIRGPQEDAWTQIRKQVAEDGDE